MCSDDCAFNTTGIICADRHISANDMNNGASTNGERWERRLCEEVHLNLAYRWFCRLGLDWLGIRPFDLLEES
jgi:hypothetical protein